METPSVNTNSFPNFPLAELHAHLATSISPSVYWQIAQTQGFKLPKRDYHEFIEHVMLTERKKMSLNEYFKEIYHPILDKLSSGTHAVERAVYESMSGAYRANNIHLIELRNNPMKHNQGGDVDLDHVIMASLRGMERALLEYDKLSAGIIFIMAREFAYEQNEIIVEKAIKYKNRGVVGIDFAGPATEGFHFGDYVNLVKKAKDAGLHVTAHSGEVAEANDLWEVLENVQPARIGHGIRAADDPELMRELVKRNIVLEVCPMSNLMTKAVKDISEMKKILRTFIDNGVKFTINTDWPEVIEGARLKKQYQMLLSENIMSEEELRRCNEIAFESTFVPKGGLSAYL